MEQTAIARAVSLLAHFQDNPQGLLETLSPQERLRLSRDLGEAFNALDRIDQAFAHMEEQGRGRIIDGGFHFGWEEEDVFDPRGREVEDLFHL